MNVWARRLLMLSILLIWLAIMILPALAFILARNGQFQIGRADDRHWRVFLIQEAETEGLGLERSSRVPPPDNAGEPARCLRTTVGYWLWSGEASNADYTTAYCQCFDATSGDVLDMVPPACLTP